MNPPTQSRKREPQVGIFWVRDGKLLIDSTPLRGAEDYGDFKTHPHSHIDVWTLFQKNRTAPIDMEYEESPRGRVMFNTKTRRFTLLADRSILRDKSMVSTMMSAMQLPSKNTDKGTDSHYRCSACPPARWE